MDTKDVHALIARGQKPTQLGVGVRTVLIVYHCCYGLYLLIRTYSVAEYCCYCIVGP